MSTTEEKAPTKEEVVAFLSEQIEVKKLQADLQELNARIAHARFKELEALSYVAQITNPSSTQEQVHTLTEEDLQKNPELAEQGLKVGDEVVIPGEKENKRSLKK